LSGFGRSKTRITFLIWNFQKFNKSEKNEIYGEIMPGSSSIPKINYENTFVAFLDVLGFKSLVQKNDDKSRRKIATYLKIVDLAVDFLKSEPLKSDIGSIIISDSIILRITQGSTNEEKINRLRSLSIAVGIIQQKLALEDIWIRGAISTGDSFFDLSKRQIVGPAYINAYLLEESLAIYPRVIIDTRAIYDLELDSAIALIDHLNKTFAGGIQASNWGSKILFDWRRPNGVIGNWIVQDIPLFIDYFSSLIEKQSPKAEKILLNVQKNIYKSAELFKKYKWVADYCNSCLEKQIEDGKPIPNKCLEILERLK